MENPYRLVDLLRARVPELQAVYHFGSTAREEGDAESDVDIAFLSGEKASATMLFELQGMCSEAAGRQVDLIELRRADPVLRCEVMADGKLIYEGDAEAVAEFEMVAMSMRCAFNEEMRDLVSAIVSRGSVYGR